MPKDFEWTNFVQRDAHFVDPDIAIRSVDRVHYPGRTHFACQEIRAGLLERKSKYLKSYTAGWFVSTLILIACANVDAGMSSHQLTCTSSSLRTRRKPPSCRCTYQSRSWARTRPREDLRTNSFSRDDKPEACIVVTPGFSVPRATTQ